MAFPRRKSGVQAEHSPQENEYEEETNSPRVRNRLSKPRSLNHNLKSSSSLPRLALQDAGSGSDVAPKSDPKCNTEVKDSPNTSTRVADLITRLEANQQGTSNSSHTSSLSLPKRKDSFRYSTSSIPEKKRSSLIPSQSKDKLTALKNDSRTSISPAPSLDDISRTPSFSRRSSFIPGAATRKSSLVDCIKEEKEPGHTATSMSASDEEPEPRIIDEDARSFNEGDDEDWQPPAPISRPETPQSLDYTHLGGLSLGSLQVVNGRASPAPSNMSKHLFSRLPIGRDTSSEYADSTNGDQISSRLNGDSVYSTRNRYRDFSWQSRGSSKLRDAELPSSPSEDVGQDPASFLASEYMAELPPSPYSVRKSSLPTFANRAATAQLIDAQVGSRSPSVRSHRSYDSIGSSSVRSSSPAPSARSETGTILVTTTKRTENEDELFDDEAVGRSPTTDRESPESWHSAKLPADPRTQSNDGFQSALDFIPGSDLAGSQPIRSSELVLQTTDRAAGAMIRIETSLLPPAQCADLRELDDRGFESVLGFRSPIELEPLTVSTPASASTEPVTSFHKSDSGYSSNASLKSASGERKQSTSKSSLEADRRSFVEKVFRPILKSRKTTSSDVPTFKNIRPSPPASAATSTTILSQPRTDPKQAEQIKKQKRLTKRLPSGKQKQPIVLQTIQSIDDLTIPPVSVEASENLRIRTQAVPELDSTYSSMDHVRNRHSVSTLSMLDDYPEIRFPSPEPVKSTQQRRRSWFGRSKDEKPTPSKRDSRDISGISQAHALAIMNDWEAIAPSLSGSHYDQIPSRRNSMKQQQAQQQARKLRHRSMMDDRTAAELARYRSSSIRERDAWNEKSVREMRRQTSGSKPRPKSMVLNMPPMPFNLYNVNQRSTDPMLERSSSDYMPPEPRVAPPPPPHSPRPQSVDEEDIPQQPDYDAPPPPPHSPRPTSICHEDYFEEPGSFIPEDDLAPPPPSHSPRPVDITEEDPWAAQAAMWKSHREQATSQQEQDTSFDQSDQVYPAIPPRHRYFAHSSRPDSVQGRGDPCDYDYEEVNSWKAPQKRHTMSTYNPSWNSYEQDYDYAPPWNGRNGEWHQSTAWTSYDRYPTAYQATPVMS